jgi:branched-chain amino acid transport system ATP-binding protein
MLTTTDLCSGYVEDVLVLRDVDVAVRPGEVVTILGANGAGKTTLLQTIVGTIPARSGAVQVNGTSVRGWSPARMLKSGVALVPEGRGILVGLSVRENLEMGAYITKSRSVVARRLEEAWQRFPRLGERRNLKAGVLSGGEQQMLAIARALMSEPRFLLLDEPSTGLAPKIVTELMTEVRELANGGVGVLLVEQNAKAALRIADGGHVLESGRVVLSGTAQELQSNDDVRSAYLGI